MAGRAHAGIFERLAIDAMRSDLLVRMAGNGNGDQAGRRARRIGACRHPGAEYGRGDRHVARDSGVRAPGRATDRDRTLWARSRPAGGTACAAQASVPRMAKGVLSRHRVGRRRGAVDRHRPLPSRSRPLRLAGLPPRRSDRGDGVGGEVPAPRRWPAGDRRSSDLRRNLGFARTAPCSAHIGAGAAGRVDSREYQIQLNRLRGRSFLGSARLEQTACSPTAA